MVGAIFGFLTVLLQAILEIFRSIKKTPVQQEATKLQADRDELDRALASGDANAISIAFEKLRQRALVQVPQVPSDKVKP